MTLADPKISVCIITYNQHNYIKQCIQSILDQKSKYDFEIIIGDDCSTDGTQAIIQKFKSKFPDKIRVIIQSSNTGGTGNYIAVHKAARGEYIAHIDGDDYAFPCKLEALADVLEHDSDVNVVWHRNMILDQATGAIYPDKIDTRFEPVGGFQRKHLLSLGSVGVHSAMMYRSSQRDKIDYSHRSILDYYVSVECIGEGKGRWVDIILGVYRINSGLWSSQNIQSRGIFLDHLNFFLRKYPIDKKYINSLLLYLLLYDLKCMKVPSVFKLWLKSFHYLSFIILASNFRFFKNISIAPGPVQ